jgi:hypothetical protein
MVAVNDINSRYTSKITKKQSPEEIKLEVISLIIKPSKF